MNINLLNDIKIELAYKRSLGVKTLEFDYLMDRFYPQQESKILDCLKELAKDKFIFINYRAEFIFIRNKPQYKLPLLRSLINNMLYL